MPNGKNDDCREGIRHCYEKEWQPNNERLWGLFKMIHVNWWDWKAEGERVKKYLYSTCIGKYLDGLQSGHA